MTTVSRRTWATGGLIVAVATALAAPVPEKKAPPEPEWMTGFRKAYELKDGEYVRRVPKPLPAEREEFLLANFYKTLGTDREAESRRDYKRWAADYLTLMAEQDGKALSYRTGLSSAYLQGNPQRQRRDTLLTVWTAIELVTGRGTPEVVVDPKSKDDPLFADGNLTVGGDFVVRKNAPLDKLAPQLEKILRDECGLDVRLTMKEEEQPVFVVGGKFAVKPPEWRDQDKKEIDVYATEDGLNKEYQFAKREFGRERAKVVSTGTYGSRDLVEFVRFVGERVGTRMVWDAPLPADAKLTWHNHTLRNPTKEQEAEDKDPAKVLANVTAQTGLTFKKEKRKVPVLVVGVPEKK